MKTIIKISALLASVIHILFFCLESLLWTNPKVQKIFGQSAETISATKLLAFNQGFYNLFFALGIIAALLVMKKNQTIGFTLLAYIGSCMLGAALVLLYSSPTMITGVLAQGVPPMVMLLGISVYCNKNC
ncbi:DUF1304 domain-containing protein [Candidatus Uabimicrobium sp. HlEnr_7]|uniref:DUF1304 domain-containing protein n=1 Tax=Candidatus Uabimicrobium helgolandensis TaxID=3095367 RepID=UPI00355803A9